MEVRLDGKRCRSLRRNKLRFGGGSIGGGEFESDRC